MKYPYWNRTEGKDHFFVSACICSAFHMALNARPHTHATHWLPPTHPQMHALLHLQPWYMHVRMPMHTLT